MKKNLLLIALALCCAMTMFAQNSNKISYQAVIRNNANELVANKMVNVTITIIDADNNSYTQEFPEVQTNLNGLVSLLIGPDEPDFHWNSIHWDSASVVTTVTLDGEPIGTLTMPLTAVPYALYTNHAAEINPNAAVVIGIYNKIKYDSLALSIHLNDTLNEYVKKDGLCDEVKICMGGDLSAVYEKMKADSTSIYEKMKADSAAIYVKMKADSAALGAVIAANTDNITITNNNLTALQNRVNTFNTNVCDSVLACNVITDMRDSIQLNRDSIRINAAAIKTNTEAIATKADAQTVSEQIAALNTLVTALTTRVNHLHDSIEDIINNTPVMAQDSFTVAQAGQTEFTLKNVPHADHVLRIYINGVMVGGNHSGVLTTTNDPTSKVVVYDANQNKNRDGNAYHLKVGDKVTIVYWYVKPATATTSGN